MRNLVLATSALMLSACVSGPMSLPLSLKSGDVTKYDVKESGGSMTKKPNLSFATQTVNKHTNSWPTTDRVTTEPWYVPEDTKIAVEKKYQYRFGKTGKVVHVGQCANTAMATASKKFSILGDAAEMQVFGGIKCKFFSAEGAVLGELDLKTQNDSVMGGTLKVEDQEYAVEGVVTFAEHPDYNIKGAPLGYIILKDDQPIAAIQVNSTTSNMQDNEGAVWLKGNSDEEHLRLMGGVLGAVWYYDDLTESASNEAYRKEMND